MGGLVGIAGMVEMSISCKKIKTVNSVSSDNTWQPRSILLPSSCVLQRRYITVCKVDQHQRECLLSFTPVAPVSGQIGDAGKHGWRDGGEGWKGGEIDTDERNGSDRFRREAARERWRDGSKERSGGREPSRCSQHVCLLLCRISSLARGMTTHLLACRPDNWEEKKGAQKQHSSVPFHISEHFI